MLYAIGVDSSSARSRAVISTSSCGQEAVRLSRARRSPTTADAERSPAARWSGYGTSERQRCRSNCPRIDKGWWVYIIEVLIFGEGLPYGRDWSRKRLAKD